MKYPPKTLTTLLLCWVSILNIAVNSFLLLNAHAVSNIWRFKKESTLNQQAPFTTAQDISFNATVLAIQQQLSINPNTRKATKQTDFNNVVAHVAQQKKEKNPNNYNKGYIVIPRLRIITPFKFENGTKSINKELEKGAISLSPFTSPTLPARNIIMAHSSDFFWKDNNYATVFTLLPQLKEKDIIKVYVENQEFLYEVERSVISPANLSTITQASPQENELVLSTCYPIGLSTNRYNVIAKPKLSLL